MSSDIGEIGKPISIEQSSKITNITTSLLVQVENLFFFCSPSRNNFCGNYFQKFPQFIEKNSFARSNKNKNKKNMKKIFNKNEFTLNVKSFLTLTHAVRINFFLKYSS